MSKSQCTIWRGRKIDTFVYYVGPGPPRLFLPNKYKNDPLGKMGSMLTRLNYPSSPCSNSYILLVGVLVLPLIQIYLGVGIYTPHPLAVAANIGSL